MRTPNDYPTFQQGIANESFVRYDPATGEITATGETQRFIVDIWQLDNGEPVLRTKGEMGRDYVDLATLKVLPRQVIEPTVNGLTFSNLPVPCTVTIDNVAYPVNDGVAELVLDPGSYTVVFEAVTHLPREVTVDV